MKKLVLTISLCLVMSAFLLHAEEHTNISSSVAENTDIHFSRHYCLECHEDIPLKGGEKLLKFNGDYTQLCKCHGYAPGSYIHPVDIVPSKEKRINIPDSFPLADGKVSCLTCHDMYVQISDDSLIVLEVHWSNLVIGLHL